MKLEDLRAAQVDERGTDSLQPLPADFYEQVADYLAELRDRRDRLAERADDPFDSPEIRQLTDELETAEEVAEAVYERRLSKVVKRASLAASGVPADEDGLTDEERRLFADIVERIRENRSVVLDVLEEGSAPDVDPPVDRETDPGRPGPPEPQADEAPETVEPSRAEAAAEPPASPGSQPEPDGGARVLVAEEDEAAEEDRLTVRVTADVGEIYGVDDRVYTLGEEDVVTLPSANAKPLLDRGAAERVE